MLNLPMKWIYVAYAAVMAGCMGFVLVNREPGLGIVGVAVLALAIASVATVLLGTLIVVRKKKR